MNSTGPGDSILDRRIQAHSPSDPGSSSIPASNPGATDQRAPLPAPMAWHTPASRDEPAQRSSKAPQPLISG